MAETLQSMDASTSSASQETIESESGTGEVARRCRVVSLTLDKLTDLVHYLSEPINSLTESVNSLPESTNSLTEPINYTAKPVNASIDSPKPLPIPNIPIQPKPPMPTSQLVQMVNPMMMMMVPGPSPYFMPMIQQPIPSPKEKESQSAASKPRPIAPAGFGFIQVPVMAVPFSYAAVPPGNPPFEMMTSYVQNPFMSETTMSMPVQFAGVNVDNKPSAEVPIKAKRGRPRKVRVNETVSTVPLQKIPKAEINDQDSVVSNLNSSPGTPSAFTPVPKRRGRKPNTVNKLIQFSSINQVQPIEDSNAMQYAVRPSDQQNPVNYCVKEKD